MRKVLDLSGIRNKQAADNFNQLPYMERKRTTYLDIYTGHMEISPLGAKYLKNEDHYVEVGAFSYASFLTLSAFLEGDTWFCWPGGMSKILYILQDVSGAN